MMLRKLVAFGIASLSMAIALHGCKEKKTGNPVTTVPSIVADTDAIPTALPSAVVNAAPNAACVVAYVTWPTTSGPTPGDDLDKYPPRFSVPEGASISISVRRTGHEVRIKGPAVFRGCTKDEPDVVLLASGDASIEGTAPVHPGAELFLATPAFVAVVSRATVRVHASIGLSSWEVDDGDVTVTNLDTPTPISGKNKGSLKRYEDGGVLLTRCGVQAAAAASAERMLLRFSQDSGPPLPAASIGVLTAQQIRHQRERVLDCAFAEAFGLGCDAAAAVADAPPAGCTLTYARVREHIGRSVTPQPLPPGSPIDAGTD
ncbi:MAG: hypothetical protein ACXWUG_07365 [Polyangiales bacterium]